MGSLSCGRPAFCGMPGCPALCVSAVAMHSKSHLQLRGPWAFVIYDRSHGRIVAARDPAGEEPLACEYRGLHWGLVWPW